MSEPPSHQCCALPASCGGSARSYARIQPGSERASSRTCSPLATGLVAGLVLGSITGTLELLPGLLVLVPAAVGLRGNVFGALGSRLGTLVATGSFRLSVAGRDTLVGQNLAASVALSLGVSLLLAFVAKGIAEALRRAEHDQRSPTSSSSR